MFSFECSLPKWMDLQHGHQVALLRLNGSQDQHSSRTRVGSLQECNWRSGPLQQDFDDFNKEPRRARLSHLFVRFSLRLPSTY